MDLTYFAEKKFEKEVYTAKPLAVGEYEDCEFRHCDFSNSSIAGSVFINCRFTDCNLMMCKTGGTALRDVKFSNCKLLGIRFENCDPFLLSVSFSKCILNLAGFFKMSLKKTAFTDCTLHETDFSGADLTQAVLANCDCHLAVFDRTNLTKADLRGAFNYQIDPTNNQVKKMKVSHDGLHGLLHRFDLDIR
ncbi:MAG: pentapeptide repeat-containing protein [Chitinophagaceae bacterium]|nr:MAG: pentapeptide repeat-containing protein [Chitinophagaceae bacterium]